MNHYELLEFFKQYPDTWFSTLKLSKIFNMDRGAVRRHTKKLYDWNFLKLKQSVKTLYNNDRYFNVNYFLYKFNSEQKKTDNKNK